MFAGDMTSMNPFLVPPKMRIGPKEALVSWTMGSIQARAPIIQGDTNAYATSAFVLSLQVPASRMHLVRAITMWR